MSGAQNGFIFSGDQIFSMGQSLMTPGDERLGST